MKVCAVFCSLVMLGAAVIVVAAEPAPPAELTIPLPEKAQAAETLPAPQGEAPRAAQPLRIEIPLNVLGRGVAPADREEARRFGLDMANRGISFGLRFLDRGVTPDEARQFGLEMGERGAGFGVKIVGENIDLDALNLGGPDGLKLPKADAPPTFQAVPGDIQIETPKQIEAPKTSAAPKSGRDIPARPRSFRREF